MFLRCGILSALVFMFLTTAALAAEIKQGPFIPGDRGTITGRILIDGKEPMPGGIAAFFNAQSEYPPKFGSLRRVPDGVTRVDRGGAFTAQLPAGRYYLGAILREDPGETGPPAHDEKGFAAVDGQGNRRIFEISGGGTTRDLGAVHVATAKADWKFTDYFTLRGTVINKNGEPFAEGAWILVKRNPVARRPAYISEKIGGDGQFELQLPAGQPYFLIARDMLGRGRPDPGRHVGAYTGPDPVFDQNMPEPKPIALSAAAGETVSGIRILMIEVPVSGLPQEILQGQPTGRQGQAEGTDMK